jgi:hypothetical protein
MVTDEHNSIVGLMIPEFVLIPDVPYGVLPPGVHWATVAELEARFAHNDRRRWLFEGFLNAAGALRRAGCRTMYLGGSFVTAKAEPGDFDGCWDPTNVQAALLDPVFLDFDNERAAQKWAYRGELFISSMTTGSRSYFDFLQFEKETDAAVGIVGIRLRAETGLTR